MKAYVAVTGVLFAIITAAHVWEVIDRGHLHHSDILILAASIALSVWAWRLWRRTAA